MSAFKDQFKKSQDEQAPAPADMRSTFQAPSDERKRLTSRLPKDSWDALDRISYETKVKVNPLIVALVDRLAEEYRQTGDLSSIQRYLDQG